MSTTYTRYFSALSDYNAGNPIDDRDIDGEFDAMTIALNRKVLCSGSAPSSPIAGQTWVDTTNKLLKWYRNGEWVVIGIVHTSSTAPTTMQSGDLWIDSSGSENVTKVRNKANDAWITLSAIDISGGTAWQGLHSNGGTAPVWGGAIVQIQYASTASAFTCANTPADGTIPQSSEGTEIITVSITPKATANRLLIEFGSFGQTSSNVSYACMAIFQDSTADAIYAIHGGSGWGGGSPGWSGAGCHEMAAGTTSATTFKLRIGGNATEVYVNRANGTTTPYSTVGKSWIKVTEYVN